MEGLVKMEIKEILAKFDGMLAEGRTREAGEYLDKMAVECGSSGDTSAAISIFNELEGFWRVAGEAEKSYAAAEAAIGLLKACGLEGGIDYATTLLNYATAKAAFGDTAGALELFRRVEKIYGDRLEADDYRFASLYNNMAQSLMHMNDAGSAGDYFVKSLAILEKLDGVEEETATCHTNTAICLMLQKRLDEARASLEKAEKIFSSLPESPHFDSMLASRGQLEFIQGRFAEAADCYKRAAANIEKRFGRNIYYSRACRNCAKAMAAAGDRSGAEEYKRLAESSEGGQRA